MEIRSFTVLASRKSDVEEQFTKLNKRATRLGIDNITWTWGKARMESRKVLWQDPKYFDMPPVYIRREMLVLPIEITGPLEVKFDGWRFIATLQHLPTGENIVRPIANDVEVPKHYRETGSLCEHCNIKRYRKDTYVLHHDDEGEVQVGSTCIKDFLGGNSPDSIVGKANFISELITFMEGMENYSGGGGATGFFINEFLATTVACINKFGWLSKSKAEMEGGQPTAEIVMDVFIPPKNCRGERIEVTDEDKEKGKLAADWCESLPDELTDGNEYLYNIRAISRSGMVDRRTAGFAASIVAAYNKSMVDKEPKTNSNYVGTIKERKVFPLTVKRYNVFDGSYGVTHQYIFHDDEGNVFCWYASSKQDMEVGSKYAVKGTIKSHTEYKGVRQTNLTRCTIL